MRDREEGAGRERERERDYAVIQRETESFGGEVGPGSSLGAVSAMQCLLLVDPRMLSAWTYVMYVHGCPWLHYVGSWLSMAT